jgi:hypothetical protein
MNGVSGMNYAIKSHPTTYKGVMFRSRLEARWAAYFDLIGWKWKYEPIDLVGWTPDFFVSFPCGHSECSGSHELAVEVKPYRSIEEFRGHPCMDYPYGQNDSRCIPADASAAFGIDPTVTQWEFGHGAGGGIYSLDSWFYALDMDKWNEAGNLTQWRPR